MFECIPISPSTRLTAALVAIALIATIGYVGYTYYLAPKPPVKPIKIAILTDFTSPVLKSQGIAAITAIEEINATGGILGRPLQYVWLNTMRKVDVCVSAYRKAIVEEGCKYVILEGVSEEMLALMEEGKVLYPQYPHVLMYCGAAGAVSLKIIGDYDKYRFAFRPFEVEYDFIPARAYDFFWYAKNVLKVNKVALFIEDAAWTVCAREGYSASTKLGEVKKKPMRDIAKDLGLDVVYEVNVAVGEKNFVPMLEVAAAKGAELIFVLSSYYTDCVTLAKQWAASSAKDAYLMLHAGPNQWATFWNLTGGAALGVISAVFDVEDFPPVSPRTQPFIKKMHEKGCRVDIGVHAYYSIVYHLKAAIEKAGDADNIEAVIKALEEVEFEGHTLLPRVTLGERSPLFHSYPAMPYILFQFQGPDRIVCVSDPNSPFLTKYYSKEFLERYCRPELVKSPAELRRLAGAG